MGIDPYPANTDRSHTLQEINDKQAELMEKEVTVAGRVKNIREHGKLVFIDIEEDTTRLQLYIKEDTIKSHDKSAQNLGWSELGLLDNADFVQATGTITKTQSGELSVLVTELKMLAKTIRPTPTELEDKEDRFRRRYVDMNVHPEVRERMKRRSLFWQAHRDFFEQQGFYEVNIPVLEHVPGGGDAVPFTTHMNAINEDFFLRISHELPLKRLIGGGFEKVYDIGARFRNEGLSDEHLPEHVAMEFYWAYANWEEGMQLIQDLFQHIIKTVYPGQTKFNIREFEDVDFSGDWERIDFNDVMKQKYGIKNIYSITLEEVKDLLNKQGIEFDRSVNIARGVDALWKRVRKTIKGPAFLVNHPKYLSPLQKASLVNENMVERFQPIVAGSELGNGWNEVNDPVDQYERFLEQQKLRDSGDEEAQWLDIDYVEMLEYGMPPTFGYGHSERIFWFLENVTAKEGVPFPQLKFEVDELTKRIYPDLISTEKSSEPKEADKGMSLNINSSNMNTTREQALEFLKKYVSTEYLLHHSEMVATAMEAAAKHLGADNADKWYITGLIHDWDFDKWPEEHPGRYDQLHAELGVDDEVVGAIKGHGDKEFNRSTKMMQALLALDELSGLFYAYMKMVGKYADMKVSSVQKKLHKELNFAAKIDRSYILKGIEELGIPEEELLTIIRDAFAAKYD